MTAAPASSGSTGGASAQPAGPDGHSTAEGGGAAPRRSSTNGGLTPGLTLRDENLIAKAMARFRVSREEAIEDLILDSGS
jgi:hypothetical protein